MRGRGEGWQHGCAVQGAAWRCAGLQHGADLGDISGGEISGGEISGADLGWGDLGVEILTLGWRAIASTVLPLPSSPKYAPGTRMQELFSIMGHRTCSSCAQARRGWARQGGARQGRGERPLGTRPRRWAGAAHGGHSRGGERFRSGSGRAPRRHRRRARALTKGGGGVLHPLFSNPAAAPSPRRMIRSARSPAPGCGRGA